MYTVGVLVALVEFVLLVAETCQLNFVQYLHLFQLFLAFRHFEYLFITFNYYFNCLSISFNYFNC